MVENVPLALMAIILIMVSRGIFVLAGVIEGLRYLHELDEQNKQELAKLRKQAVEGLCLLILITGVALALFLFIDYVGYGHLD